MDKIKVLLLEKANDERKDIEKIFLNVDYLSLIGTAETEKVALDIIETHKIDVILIGVDVEGDGYAISEKISMGYPELVIIILETALQEETMHRAFISGASEVLIKPISPSQLVDTIYKTNELLKRKISINKESMAKVKVKAGRGKVFTVFSTKGGVGKTFIATNLAVLLAANKSKRVVLIDLDLDFGNVALALNIHPRYTLTDIIDDIRNVEQDSIESYLTLSDTGIWVLPGNPQPMMSEYINVEHIDLILKALQKTFDYVVIDMPGRFSEKVNPAFANADQLLMVVTPEVSTLKNLKTALITLNELNYPKTKIKVILNRATGKEIKTRDVETTLNVNILAPLNTDYRNVITAMNVGIPYVIKNPYSKLSRDLKNMIKKFSLVSD